MDINDPRLEEAHKNMVERVEKYDERIVTVLKCHLTAEQALDDLLGSASRQWKRRSFAGKIDVVEKLFLPELDPPMWAVFAIRAGHIFRRAKAVKHTA